MNSYVYMFGGAHAKEKGNYNAQVTRPKIT